MDIVFNIGNGLLNLPTKVRDYIYGNTPISPTFQAVQSTPGAWPPSPNSPLFEVKQSTSVHICFGRETIAPALGCLMLTTVAFLARATGYTPSLPASLTNASVLRDIFKLACALGALRFVAPSLRLVGHLLYAEPVEESVGLADAPLTTPSKSPTAGDDSTSPQVGGNFQTHTTTSPEPSGEDGDNKTVDFFDAMSDQADATAFGVNATGADHVVSPKTLPGRDPHIGNIVHGVGGTTGPNDDPQTLKYLNNGKHSPAKPQRNSFSQPPWGFQASPQLQASKTKAFRKVPATFRINASPRTNHTVIKDDKQKAEQRDKEAVQGPSKPSQAMQQKSKKSAPFAKKARAISQ